MKKIIFALFIIVLLVSCTKPSEAETADYQRDYLIVVNQDHSYTFGDKYDLNLQDDLAVTKQDTTGDEEKLEYKALQAFSDLRRACRNKGILIGLLSGYRSKADQDWLYENYDLTPQVRGGYSEHHTGLNISLIIDDYLPDGDGPYWLSEGNKIPENEQVTELLPDYGFIRRYPAGKENITGHEAAPYEIRFVGSPEVAHEIMDNGLCLEEYVLQKCGGRLACE
ncbi:D-alanyl-D-alanine carboxypeptidase family protein [Candidatus Saccharibacteria bacterium]|nr:D-alanyl-D-alanine carboxypeptidase family protein [Candidatus Saccharibacteria bacterium]